jgi:hypothetical protein
MRKASVSDALLSQRCKDCKNESPRKTLSYKYLISNI